MAPDALLSNKRSIRSKTGLRNLRAPSPWFAGNPLAMWIYDLETLRFLDLNESAERQYGYTRAEFLEMTLESILGPDSSASCEHLSSDADNDRVWTHLRKDGTQILVKLRTNNLQFRGRPARFVVAEDVTEMLHQQKQLLRLAHHDALTGLPNRILLQQRMVQALDSARERSHRMAIICVDLDRFKQVNDRYGHHAGDECLKHIGEMLTRRLRGMDTVARTGGEEFTVVLGEVESVAAAGIVAKALGQAFSQPIEMEGDKILLSASMGVAVYPDHGAEAVALWRSADAAMYRAKRAGGNRQYMVASGRTTAAIDTGGVEAHLRDMLMDQAFQLHYQLQYDMDGEIRGMEALLRLPYSQAHVLSPDRFIPIAEENGLIHPLGRWVIEEACRQLRLWNVDPHHPVSIAVNVSPLQLMRSDFLAEVQHAIARSGINPQWLEIELTERVVLDIDEAAERMVQLAAMGIRFALDDFGTGYSSLQHLQRLPISTLKIDRSFIQQLCESSRSYSIVKAIIAMGHGLQMQVIAEGVEREDQRSVLRELGCDCVQGFLMSRPSDPETIDALLATSGILC